MAKVKAKDTYAVPASLQSSWLDMEMPLGVDAWNSFTIRFRSVFFGVVSFSAYMIVAHSSEALQSASLLTKVIVITAWIFITWLFAFRDSSGNIRASHVIPIVKYILPSNRKVRCRLGDDALPILGVIPLRPHPSKGVVGVDVSTSSGSIKQWVMRVYVVTGNASALLFQDDREQVLSHVASFWEHFPEGVEVIQMSRKEFQDTDIQTLNLQKRHDEYVGGEPEIEEMFAAEMSMFTAVEQYSRITYQYWCVLAPNIEALDNACAYIAREAKTTNWVFRSLEMIDEKDIEDVFACAYNGMQAGLSDL